VGRRACRLEPQLSTLYVVATPIGNLEDVTLRALRVLGEVSAIAAEDTRVTARLLARHGIRKPLLSYRAPVEARGLPRVLAALGSGDVALVSDAGTPTLSDPGRLLVEAAWEAGHQVVPLPGASAITSAVAVSGFPGEGFTFAGYVPRKPGERRRLFGSLPEHPVVLFESPHRIRKTLVQLAAELPEARVAVCRELTKLHEQVLRGSPAEVLAQLPEPVRGEVTLVIAPQP
jgi:16S rRNA (cytidine1402-2'-O)-methyltransferase